MDLNDVDQFYKYLKIEIGKKKRFEERYIFFTRKKNVVEYSNEKGTVSYFVMSENLLYEKARAG